MGVESREMVAPMRKIHNLLVLIVTIIRQLRRGSLRAEVKCSLMQQTSATSISHCCCGAARRSDAVQQVWNNMGLRRLRNSLPERCKNRLPEIGRYGFEAPQLIEIIMAEVAEVYPLSKREREPKGSSLGETQKIFLARIPC